MREPAMITRGDLVNVNGGTWRVLAVGAVEGEATYVHLVATDGRGVQQKNGFRPAQACGWLRGSTLSGDLR